MGVTFLICAAGQGLRTKALDPSLPKALLDLQGQTMLMWSLSSLPVEPDDLVVIIGQEKDHLEREHSRIRERYPNWNVQWVNLNQQTRGQLETAVLGLQQVPQEFASNSIAIFNCDTFFQASKLREMIDAGDAEGLIPCAKEPGLSWSFCRVSSENQIVEVAEKKRISDWCSVGFYFFRDPQLFHQMSRQELSENLKGEFYVAPLYNRYLQAEHSVRLVKAESFKPMGSMEQIRDYWPSK